MPLKIQSEYQSFNINFFKMFQDLQNSENRVYVILSTTFRSKVRLSYCTVTVFLATVTILLPTVTLRNQNSLKQNATVIVLSFSLHTWYKCPLIWNDSENIRLCRFLCVVFTNYKKSNNFALK